MKPFTDLVRDLFQGRFGGSADGDRLHLPHGMKIRVRSSHPGAVYKRGDRIAGAYDVMGVLGVGGFSVVYLAYKRDTRSLYALKTLRDQYLKEVETREQFSNEAKVWVDLERHPYVVRAHFIEELAGRLYIGMEYIEPDDAGINSLEGCLARRPPELAQTLRWSIQFCLGMEHAYARGIRCHRDVKPANIMITRGMDVKITDFGFADIIDVSRARNATDPLRRKRRTQIAATGFGTPTYMPPEQFKNAASADHRSDIYSFGVVLYQMASRGRHPYTSRLTMTEIMKKSAASIWHEMHRLHANEAVVPLQSPLFPIIQRCLEKDPSRRYQSFKDLRQDLEPVLKKIAGETIDAHPLQNLQAWELYNKAYSLSSLGHLDEAVGYYDKVLELEPQNADAWNNKGVCLRKQGKLAEALACFTSATSISKDNASAWGNRGNCLYALNRNEEAIADLAKAISRDAKNEVAWLNKGMAEERLGRKADAARSYASFLSLNPVQHSAHVPFAKKRIAELSGGGTNRGRTS